MKRIDVSVLAQTWKNLSYGQAARNESLLMSVADEVVDLRPISGDGHMVVVPIRSGLGLRLGYNVGYLKFTSASA